MKKTSEQELISACYDNDIEKAKKCLEQGASVNSALNDGRTVLWSALHLQHYAMAQFLLKQPGIEVNTIFDSFKTHPLDQLPPVCLVTRSFILDLSRQEAYEAFATLDLLAQKGADLDAIDGYDYATALSKTVTQRSSYNTSLITWLINSGATMKVSGAAQLTPLQNCVSHVNGRTKNIIALLRSSGISLRDLKKAQDVCWYEQLQRRNIAEIDSSFHGKDLKIFLRKARILKQYFMTMKNMGYVHPTNDAWQYTPQCKFPREIAQIIAHYAAQNAEYTVVDNNLRREQIHVFEQANHGKLLDIYELLVRCKEYLQFKNKLDDTHPLSRFSYFTPFTQFMEMLQYWHTHKKHVHRIRENERTVGAFILTTPKLRSPDDPESYTADIQCLAVDPNFQGQKIGNRCLASIETIAQEEKCTTLRAIKHPLLATFYEKNGFILTIDGSCYEKKLLRDK